MYGNEHEIRRMLLFLIERIPREDEKTSDSREGDQLSNGSITQRLKNLNVSTIWIPYSNEDLEEEEVDDNLKYSSESDQHDHYSRMPSNGNAVHTAANLGFRLGSFLTKSHPKPLQRYAKWKLSQPMGATSTPNLLLPQSVMDILEWNSRFYRSAQFDEDDSHLSGDPVDSYLTRCRANKKNPIKRIDGHLSALTFTEIATIPLQQQSSELNNQATQSIGTEKSTEVKELTKEEVYAQSLEKLRKRIRDYDEQITQWHEKEDLLARCEVEYQEKCKLFEASFKTKEEVRKTVYGIIY